MLKGKFVGQYRSSRTGNLVFKYDISGKAEDVQDYSDTMKSLVHLYSSRLTMMVITSS
jgi:hypothetical protein